MTSEEKHRKHKNANKKLGFVLERDGYKCFWCQRPLFRLGSSVEKQQAKTKLVDGKVYWYATIDHIVDLAAGGTNDTWNLVPACQSCNAKRNAVATAASPDKKVCPECGHSKKLCNVICRVCRKKHNRAWLIQNGRIPPSAPEVRCRGPVNLPLEGKNPGR